jgi:hypothetical protein
MNAPTPRYSLTVSTKNADIFIRRNEIKKTGKTDEDIYLAGIEALERLKNND